MPATPPMTAEALVCWQFLGMDRKHPAGKTEAGEHILGELPPGKGKPGNIYYWYYATLGMYQWLGHALGTVEQPASPRRCWPARRMDRPAGRFVGQRHGLGRLRRPRLFNRHGHAVPRGLLPLPAALRVGRRRPMSRLPAGEPQAMNRISSRTACPAWSAVNGVCSSMPHRLSRRGAAVLSKQHMRTVLPGSCPRRAASSRSRSDLARVPHSSHVLCGISVNRFLAIACNFRFESRRGHCLFFVSQPESTRPSASLFHLQAPEPVAGERRRNLDHASVGCRSEKWHDAEVGNFLGNDVAAVHLSFGAELLHALLVRRRPWLESGTLPRRGPSGPPPPR